MKKKAALHPPEDEKAAKDYLRRLITSYFLQDTDQSSTL